MNPVPAYFWADESRLADGAAACFAKIAQDFGGGKVGLKVHFGETENPNYVNPGLLRGALDVFPEASFVDCNVLYRGARTTGGSHRRLALEHGFDFLPVEILDGELGEDTLEVEVNKGDTRNALLGAGLSGFRKLVAVSHFKGHIATGFGGALKNAGMGLASRPGKLFLHSVIAPYVKQDKCVACGTCVRECPADAITLDGKASINKQDCIGCAHCVAACPEGAVDIPWDLSGPANEKLMRRIAEYSLAALKGRGWWFLNFIVDVTFNCDCMNVQEKPFMGDVGMVLSRDPVAADAASLDLVKERCGGADPFLEKHGVDGSRILEYAETIGVGSKKYEIESLE